jgi:hypothetical protein
MALISLPFSLPQGFLVRLGYRGDRRIVAVWFEPGIDEVAFTDAVHGLVGADRYVYWELTRRTEVQAWIRDHGINFGNSDQSAAHWLIVDRVTERAYVADVVSARDHIRTQILEEWAG